MSNAISMRDMLEAGVHFGHQNRRWNPKMKPYIWGSKNGVYIINLQKTVRLFQDALQFATHTAQRGDQILFVGTKRQAQDVIKTQAERCGMPYVNHRWLGGMLTNFRTIKSSLERIDEIEKKLAVGNVERLTKKEVTRLERHLNKLLRSLGGIRNMSKLPAAVFIVDTVKEHLAVKDCIKLGIPIIALVDTNSDPDVVDYPIPSNDDAIRAIRLFTSAIADACTSGAQMGKEKLLNEMTAQGSTPVQVVRRGAAADEAAEAAEATDAEAAAEAAAPEAPAPAPAATAAAPAAEAPAEAEAPAADETPAAPAEG